MVKLKPVKSKKENLNKKNQKSKTNSEIKSFLKEIKTNINKKKSSKNNLYSLISCIFLCFHENKKKILDKKEICDFIKKEIVDNNNKIITYNLKLTKSKKSEFEIVTTRNYYPKLNHILNNSKCITKIVNMETNKEEQYELNEEYIIERKLKIINHLFKPKSFPQISPSPIKRKRRKFEFCLSSVKKEKNDKKEEKEKAKDNKKDIKDKNKEIINDKKKDNNEKCEDDSSIISSKETDINEKKEKEKDNNCPKIDKFSNNKLEGKKNDKKNDKKKNNTFLNQKRKSPVKIDNCLKLPKFVDQSAKDNENKSKTNDKDINNDINEKRDEIIASSLKAKNAIIDQGQQFIILLENKKFINALIYNDINNNNIRVNEHFLLNYKNNSLINFLTNANNEYVKFSDLIINIMKNKVDIFDLNEDSDELFSDKELNNSDKFQIKKEKSSILINRIITELSHFLLEYDFVVNIIKEIYENDISPQGLKDMINFIEKNKNILSKENITHFEHLLRIELDNAANFHMTNYGMSKI